MDEEKLLFPIARIPLEITRGDVPFWRNRVFHLGLAVPAVIESLNSLHYTFFPTLPYFHIKPDDTLNIMQYLTVKPWNSLGYFSLAFYPLAIGLTFLLTTDISFSCWFFYLVDKAELDLVHRSTASTTPARPWPPPACPTSGNRATGRVAGPSPAVAVCLAPPSECLHP